MQDAVQAAAAAEERRIRADNYRATLLANLQLAEARAARDAAERHSELMRSEAELSATLADPYLGEDPAMAASSLSAYRQVCCCPLLLPFNAAPCAQSIAYANALECWQIIQICMDAPEEGIQCVIHCPLANCTFALWCLSYAVGLFFSSCESPISCASCGL